MPGRLVVAPIVEGHAEEGAVRTLFQRIGTELLGLDYVATCRPVRKPRTGLVSGRSAVPDNAVLRAAGLLKQGVAAIGGETPPGLLLVMIDADADCPAHLGPELLTRVRVVRSDLPTRTHLIVHEYETWFVAAADSLTRFLELKSGESVPADPEGERKRGKWVENRRRGARYKKTVDQPRMTAAMDLAVVRDRCPSFARLCRLLDEAAGTGRASDADPSP